jgi:glycosyltransferase involved in cell wall biosynthesis
MPSVDTKTTPSVDITVILLAGNRAHKLIAPLREAGVSVKVIDYRFEGKKWVSYLQMLKTILFSSIPTIVVTDFPNKFSLISLFIAKLRGFPFVLRLRANIWAVAKSWSKRRFWVAELIMKRADCIMPVSRFLADSVCQKFETLTEKIRVVPMPVELKNDEVDALPSQAYEALKAAGGKKIILTTINLSFEGKKDGLLKFLPIFERLLVENEVAWFIAAYGEFLDAFQDEVKHYSAIAKNVHSLGFINPIEPLLKKADLFLYFSYEDTVSGALVEAQLAGLAVVVNKDYPLFRDLISDEVTGLLIDPSDIEGTAQKITYILNNDAVRTALGRRAQHFAEENFSTDVIADSMRQVFQVLVSKKMP